MQEIFPISFDSAVFHPISKIKNPRDTPKLIQIIDPEFSAVCPKTGLPDFGRVILRYIPDSHIVELKDYKLFLRSFYGVGCFHEACMDHIISEFVKVINPKWVRIVIEWHARGGLKTVTMQEWDNINGFVNVFEGEKVVESIVDETGREWRN